MAAKKSKRRGRTRPATDYPLLPLAPDLELTDDEPDDVLGRLATAIAIVETAALAMQTREDEPVIGSISSTLQVAVTQLRRVDSDVDLALMGVTP